MLGKAYTYLSRQVKPLSASEMESMKLAVLVMLCVQNASYSLLRRYSQGVLKEAASPSSMLLVGELIKARTVLVFCDISDRGQLRSLGRQ